MEGNPGRRLSAPRPRTCTCEASAMCGLCQRGVAPAYTRSDSQGALRRQQPCLTFLDQLRPCGRSTYLSTTTTQTLATSGSDWRMAVVELGRTVPGPNYGQRARRSSPGPAPDPARRRLADIA